MNLFVRFIALTFVILRALLVIVLSLGSILLSTMSLVLAITAGWSLAFSPQLHDDLARVAGAAVLYLASMVALSMASAVDSTEP